MSRIDNPDLIKDIALHDKDKYTRSIALNYIDDNEILKNVALSGEDNFIRKIAAEKITNEKY